MLTQAQYQALKAAIDANPTWAAFPQDGDGNYALAQALNATAAPAFSVWRTDAPVDAIIDAIDWSKYTPTAGIAGTDTDPLVSRKVGWCLETQIKQMNLQLMLQGRSAINAARPNVRGGLRDACIQIPTGALDGNGKPGLTAAGGSSGATVLAVCTRNASEAEKILATASQGSDTTGTTTARVMGWEGTLTYEDVRIARAQ